MAFAANVARAIDEHTKAGDTLIRAAIGVVGYRSHVHVLDSFALVMRREQDDYMIRRAAITRGVPYITTLSAASAAVDAIIALRSRRLTVLRGPRRRTLVRWTVPATAKRSPSTSSETVTGGGRTR